MTCIIHHQLIPYVWEAIAAIWRQASHPSTNQGAAAGAIAGGSANKATVPSFGKSYRAFGKPIPPLGKNHGIADIIILIFVPTQ
jgi:hypothetical protein